MELVFFMGILFIVSFQPIFMISVLIMITLMYSLYMYSIMGTFWFSYLLLMVMLSGVLVIFTYMVSLIPNESFEIFNLIIFMMMMFMYMVMWMYFYKMDYSMITVNLWISFLSFMCLYMVGFLLSIMLLVVSLSYINDGAFRIGWLSAWMKG